MEKKNIAFEGYALIEKRAANGGDSARVFVPKAWIGRKIAIVLLENVED